MAKSKQNTQTWTPYDYSNAPTPSLYDTTGRFETKDNYNDADLARYAQDQNKTYYTGGGQYEASKVYDAIQKEKEIYNAAIAAGDQAAADAAHQRAEAWRATAGYSGGEDGSQMIMLSGAGIGNMGVSGGKPNQSPSASGSGGYMYYVGGGDSGYSGGTQASTPSAGYESMKANAMGINNDADDLARELYVNYMKNTNRTNELMGLSGLQNSGMQESSLINLGNTYQEGLYQNERARAESLQAVRAEIASMLAAGSITQAEADALYAGMVGGSYDIAAPKTGSGGGGYGDYGYYVYYPGTTAESDTGLTPTMTDAEMYSMLRGVGITDSLIDTYFTPGVAAPTYDAITAELAQRAAAKQAGTGTTGGGGTPQPYYTVGQPAAVYDDIPADQMAAIQNTAIQNNIQRQKQTETLDRWYTGLTADQFERKVADAVSSGQISVPVLTEWNKKVEAPTRNTVKFNRTPSTTYTTVEPSTQFDNIDLYWAKQNPIDAYLESLYLSGRK